MTTIDSLFKIKTMRIWHEKLIPNLCQKHLCAMWRESLGAYKILREDNHCSYRNHPATREWEDDHYGLWLVLRAVRNEMLSRGYHPKELPTEPTMYCRTGSFKWQTLEEQIAILKLKGCKCNVDFIF